MIKEEIGRYEVNECWWERTDRKQIHRKCGNCHLPWEIINEKGPLSDYIDSA